MSKTIIIAELGKNFIYSLEELSVEENLKTAKELVMVAQNSGAGIAKFQCHQEDEFLKRSPSRRAWIQRNINATPYFEFWKPLKEYCDDLNIEFLCTPMSLGSAKLISQLVSRWKIGSADITDIPLLQYLKQTGKPIIMSTGMSTLDQIDSAVALLGDSLDTLMHCVSIYPCPLEATNLGTIRFFQKRYPHLKIGYSSHTLRDADVIGAVYNGATTVEKHLTLDRDAFGPDHKVSLLPKEFSKMVNRIRAIEPMLGVEQKLVLPEEQVLWDTFRIQK